MTIAAVLPAPIDYRVLAPVPWARDPALTTELRDCLLTDYDADVMSLKTGSLASPAAALRALSAAVDAIQGAGSDLVVLGLAGHIGAFERRAGSFHTLALPGTVPGRPRSSVPFTGIGNALKRLPGSAHALVVADVIAPGTDDDGQGLAVTLYSELSAALGKRVSLLMGLSTPQSSASTTCHRALALTLGEVAAAGSGCDLDGVIERALVQTRAAGGQAHAVSVPSASQTVVSPLATVEQLPDYIRDDLFATDTGSRLDAVTELAELAKRQHPFARRSLNRLARADAAPAVRSYADTLTRQADQPSLADLRQAGRLPLHEDDPIGQPGCIPELLPQPCGKVRIGSADNEHGAGPQHHVDLQPFRLGRIPVTNRQYLAFVIAVGGPCPDHWATDPDLWQQADLPVVMVSWFDAMRYCAWLDDLLHTAGELAGGEQITLPSEAEWEAAAGNGRGDPFPWGAHSSPDVCNIRATGLNRVVPAGRFSPNGESDSGCADMIGNVWEWTRSLWGPGGRTPDFAYPYHPTDGRESLHADRSIRRIIRGGAFYYATECANAYTRNRMLPTDRHPAGSFRVAAVCALLRPETSR